MVRYSFSVACVAGALLSFTGLETAQAATIDIVRVASDHHETVYGIRDNTGSEGNDLHGALVTAHYADGSSEQIVWEADPRIFTDPDGSTYGSINGYANGDDTSLFMSWDGFEMATTSLLTSLSIDLAPASSVFDTTFIFDHNDPNGQSTLGSSFGYPFELYSEYQSLAGSITSTYSGIVNLAGAQAIGDLFTTMSLDFTGLSTGGILGNLNFRSDIDTLRYAGDLSPVPLPTSLSFLLLGLGGLGVSRRLSTRRA